MVYRFQRGQRRYRRRQRAIGVLVALGVLAFLAIGGASLYAKTSSQKVSTCTVTSKDHTIAVKSGSTTPVYRVYTDECDVLNIEDNPFFGIYNSASIYGKIKEGHTYQIKTVGWRIPFLSQFPDILEAKEIQ